MIVHLVCDSMFEVSISFSDPNGHEMEFIAPLPDQPRPNMGMLSWEEWDSISK